MHILYALNKQTCSNHRRQFGPLRLSYFPFISNKEHDAAIVTIREDHGAYIHLILFTKLVAQIVKLKSTDETISIQ